MSLSPSQQAAVDAPGHCLIVACPGSGKTHTLIARAERLLAASPTDRLAIVTFTRAAADELRDRLVARLGRAILPRVDAGTFHSLCLQQLEVVHGRGKRPFGIASEGVSHTLAMKAWEMAANARKGRPPVSREDTKRAIEFMQVNDDLQPPTGDPEFFRAALDHYRSLLKAQKLFDFTDIMRGTVGGMAASSVPRLRVRDLLVDEFQDADALQVGWVLHHASASIRTTCVGDDDQSIYGFRHARGYNGMMEFARRTNAQVITLDTTYRCAAAIVAHTSRLISRNAERVPKTIRTASRVTGIVERVDYVNAATELEAACFTLSEQVPHESAAILTRTNRVLREIQVKCEAAKIPHYGGVPGGIWSGGAPSVVFGLIGAALGKANSTGATVGLAARGFSIVCVRAARAQLIAVNGQLDTLVKSRAWLREAPDQQVQLWDECQSDYEAMLKAIPGPPLEFTSACIRFIEPGMEDFTSSKTLKSIQTIIGRMRGNLPDIYQRIERSTRDTGKDDEEGRVGIALMTLHASKGLEFDNVWMPAMRQGVLPHGNTDLAEERRLCYVGMTRARRTLTLSYSRSGDAPESIFLQEAGLLA
ncbi:ATP-dependent helicase [Rhodanobacter sp. FW106-PBR-R2A-1-13]|uniref:ATP-dependent helicase n=1 Tax=Rhodanobacter sp. FW106-PBR-R2A-1-13 TaxID=3454845 RepID=UPI0034E5F882